MENLNASMAQQIAQAAIVCQQERTGLKPQSVTVVLSGDTLVITLNGALSPAEKAVARTPQGAFKVQEFHRELFNVSVAQLRSEIERITGVALLDATPEVEKATSTVLQVFTTGTMVQVFLLAECSCGQLECEFIRKSNTRYGSFVMLVLSRKKQESVVIGGTDGIHRRFKVTVLSIQGTNVKLGFDADPDIPVHRAEVWDKIHAEMDQMV